MAGISGAAMKGQGEVRGILVEGNEPDRDITRIGHSGGPTGVPA
jgi:hypothetical protein